VKTGIDVLGSDTSTHATHRVAMPTITVPASVRKRLVLLLQVVWYRHLLPLEY